MVSRRDEIQGAGRHIPSSSEIEGGQDLTLLEVKEAVTDRKSHAAATPLPKRYFSVINLGKTFYPYI